MEPNILHENSKGVTMTREDKVKRSCVKVAKDGCTFRTYRFNNIPFYEHPLLSWANLDCCNGWIYDEDYLLIAVQEGKKPVADIFRTDLPDIAPSSTIDVAPSPTIDVWYDPEKKNHMIIARHGCLADFFDLDEIVEAYRKQNVIIDIATLEPYIHTPLITLFQYNFWVNPRNVAEWVIAGLGLGYPIESTASILHGF